ncbi:MAG TPA: ATP-binding cassette domain-containing protein, partial [Nocardioides sp.]|nr:ATP-binding cassette domain-containing protein [Nocardioides sp.]
VRLGQVLAASAADDVAALRSGGLDAEVTAEGTTYSGGQRQRIALARALASGAPVLVLHDPTTAVDSVTEGRIASGIREVRDGLTTWLLTSSPALLEAADRVVVVREGRVVAEGTHHALMDDLAYQELVLR